MGKPDILTDPGRTWYDEYVVNDPDKLLTPREVAQIFRVDEKTIRRWTIAGDLDDCAIRTPGGQLRYRESAIRARVNPDRPGPAFPSSPAGPGPNHPQKG